MTTEYHRVNNLQSLFDYLQQHGIQLNSRFDSSATAADFRIAVTLDEDEDVPFVDVKCLCFHVGNPAPAWESIIAYPEFAAGSKERTARAKIQSALRGLLTGHEDE